jgi:molybdopterin molybdotransferase
MGKHAAKHGHAHEHGHSHIHRESLPAHLLPSWLSVEEAREKILAYVDVLDVEERPLLEALGQVLAENIAAPFDVPPLPNTAMDGYAVRWEDIRGAREEASKNLKVIGELPAGAVPKQTVRPGTAIRIMTGAPIPPGADTVVPFEETDELEQRQASQGRTVHLQEVRVLRELPKGASIRPAGEDIARGEVVLRQGCTLRPQELGVLASLGRAAVTVIRRPVVGILATGNELMEPGEPLDPGKIYNSNNTTLAASVLRYGGIPRVLGIARDDLASMTAKLEEALDCDMLITSAGVSRGDYDMVKDVLARHGEVAFWTVRMKPAKPLAFGVLVKMEKGRVAKRVPHLGAPGNPVSAVIAFEQFGRPAILKMMGKTLLDKPTIEAVLEEPIENTDGRRVYARAIVTKRDGRYYARLTGNQGSGVLTSMAKANGLAICPEDVSLVEAGQVVKVQMLDWPEESF